MVESSSAADALRSNFQGRKFAPKKIGKPVERISFRALAKFAVPRKTEQFLVDHCGCDASTAKRWLSGASRPPGEALRVVVADILTRIQM
jgi:hypothetical protein